jgi:hypothetical protein
VALLPLASLAGVVACSAQLGWAELPASCVHAVLGSGVLAQRVGPFTAPGPTRRRARPKWESRPSSHPCSVHQNAPSLASSRRVAPAPFSSALQGRDTYAGERLVGRNVAVMCRCLTANAAWRSARLG